MSLRCPECGAAYTEAEGADAGWKLDPCAGFTISVSREECLENPPAGVARLLEMRIVAGKMSLVRELAERGWFRLMKKEEEK